MFAQSQELSKAWNTGLLCTVNIKASLYSKDPTRDPQQGRVIKYNNQRKVLYFKINGGLKENNGVFNLTFDINRSDFQCQHHALKLLRENGLFNKLKNNSHFNEAHQYIQHDYIPNEKLNAEQNMAITTIINSEVSYPFILFGPPGIL